MDHLLSVEPLTDAMAEDAIVKATRGNTAYVQTEVGELVVSYRKSAHLPDGDRIATVAYAALPHAILGVALVDVSDVEGFEYNDEVK